MARKTIELKGEEAFDLLINHGVLHEANRTFFNPVGLYLDIKKDGTLLLLQSEEEHGAILDTINAFMIKAFSVLRNEKHRKRQRATGFIIQTKDMIRKENLKVPITPPATLKLELLLKQVDNFIFKVKKRFMEKSKDYDIKLSDLNEQILRYDMFEDFQNDRFIDGVAKVILLNEINDINKALKEIRKIKEHQKQAYKEIR